MINQFGGIYIGADWFPGKLMTSGSLNQKTNNRKFDISNISADKHTNKLALNRYLKKNKSR